MTAMNLEGKTFTYVNQLASSGKGDLERSNQFKVRRLLYAQSARLFGRHEPTFKVRTPFARFALRFLPPI